jgi:HlyD family secretion protein
VKKFIRPLIIAVIVAAAVAAIAVFKTKFHSADGNWNFKSESVECANLVSVISASGTVEPEELVNVGSQVTGKIMNFGVDENGKSIDYGSKVKAGMLLAKIDDVLYEAELREAKAAKLQTEVAILSAEASLNQAKAQLVLAERNYSRAKELAPKGALARSNYDTYEAEYLICQANIKVSEASLEQAKAKLASAEATLLKAQRNLDYCFIKSPVDGVIIDRRVSIGQTLVSSMSASSIFLIARDMSKMQVWVSVNEADIGAIKVGMPVTFTVDAFENVVFSGVVHKIRLNATMSQNVVTYVVEVSTDNKDGKLLPYLTANVNFIRDSRENVPALSNAALRFDPPQELLSEKNIADANALAADMKENQRIVWKLNEDKSLQPIRVTIGLNDGRRSEVTGDISVGDVIVSSVSAAAKEPNGGAARSPFMPGPVNRRSNNPHAAAKK